MKRYRCFETVVRDFKYRTGGVSDRVTASRINSKKICRLKLTTSDKLKGRRPHVRNPVANEAG
jgi:hypothetical protein